MNDTRFSELANTFELTKNRIEGMSPADVAAVRVMAFYGLAASILDLFESFPELQRVTLTQELSVEMAGSLHTSIVQTHNVRISAPEAGLDFEQSPSDHEEFVGRYVPYRLMGNGAFELTRNDTRVARFLALHETQHGLWTGLVAEIASQLDHKFGMVRTRHLLS
jgi:hypothetical protein